MTVALADLNRMDLADFEAATGGIFELARTTSANATEFAGCTFSPDGRVLFFNQQGSRTHTGTVRGTTFALWGPWEEGAL